MIEKTLWHNLSLREVIEKLDSNSKLGLFQKEVVKRRRKLGPNKLPREKPPSKIEIFFEQFKSPLIYILVIAGLVVLIVGEYTDSIVIFGAVILNTVVGFFQENKASRALRELRKIIKVEVKVIREGNIKIVESEDLVPGDIFLLSPGDKVPADGRIIENFNLRTNEMVLTGEWLPAEKTTEVLAKERPLAERDNMVYMGTVAEDGKAKVIATAIGIDTEIGKVAKMVREAKEEKTPLQKKIAHFAKIIGLVIVIICTAIFIEGVISGNSFFDMFITSVTVAVAAIPEGLPVAMTVILALGMRRILRRRGLVRKLLAAETLGNTSVICTDKTATLTEGKMKVWEVATAGQIFGRTGEKSDKKDPSRLLALKIATLANEAFIENPEESMEKWVIRGRPTDRALFLAGIEAGINRKELEKKMTETAEMPFNPVNKYLARAFEVGKRKDVLYVAGAPEKLLEISKYLRKGNRNLVLTPKRTERIKQELEKLTKKGLRVVAVAYKEIKSLKDLFGDLVFVGMLALKDPVRKEVKRAMKICRQAGMRPIIVTGDHKLTAQAVVKELGFKVKEENIMEGKELDKLSDEEFERRVKNIQVYARVEPAHKMRIIEAWQKKGEVVAMTGDGINDAPALKKADIGVALGSGTDVAKETSDLILLTDSFNIIVAAVEEGRVIIDNIRKVITYLLSDSFSELILIGGSILAGLPLPILPAQILWVNLIEDSLPNIALSFEPKEKDLMKRMPQRPKEPLLTQEMKAIIFIIGLMTDLVLFGLFLWLWRQNHQTLSYIRTMIFAALAIDSLFYVFSCKSLRRNLWHINPFSNKLLLGSVAIGFLMLVLAVHLPFFQIFLKTAALNPFDWLLILGLGAFKLTLIEATKWYFVHRRA